MTVPTEIGLRVTASKILATTKLLAIHHSRLITLQGAALSSGIVSDAKQLLDENEAIEDPEKLTEFERMRAASEMASVVFAFSVLEGVLCEILEFTFEHDPRCVDKLLAKQQVSLAECARLGFADLTKSEFRKYIGKFDRSIPINKKSEILLRLLKPPPPTTNFLPGFQFQSAVLDEIRERRNTYVHRADLSLYSEPCATIDDDLDYLCKSAEFFFELLMQRIRPRLPTTEKSPTVFRPG